MQRIQLTLLKRSIPEQNATAQSIMADFSQALNDAYRQLRELLTTFRLTLQQADLPSALREMLDTLQNQTDATLDCRSQPWHWMRKCRCICCKLFAKRC
ncbi:histidine kinase [Escherichia coli]